jgi:hypothetical protein
MACKLYTPTIGTPQQTDEPWLAGQIEHKSVKMGRVGIFPRRAAAAPGCPIAAPPNFARRQCDDRLASTISPPRSNQLMPRVTKFPISSFHGRAVLKRVIGGLPGEQAEWPNSRSKQHALLADVRNASRQSESY